MGLCCGSAKKSEISDNVPPTVSPLQKGSLLYAAQLMKKTKNGKPIVMTQTSKAMSHKEVTKFQNDATVSNDMRIIFNEPFNVCNKLTPYLYLSGIASLTTENLEKLGINLIINATYEWPKVSPIINSKQVVNIRVPVDDSGQDDISIYFDEVSDKIEDNAKKGGHSLVHCMAGASRSTTIVLAYLMKHENISLVNAFKSVKKRRETGRPNIGFWEQLIKYEIKSRGKASTKMVKQIERGVEVKYPDFYKTKYPELWDWEVNKQINEKTKHITNKAEKTFNPNTQLYE